MNPAQKIDAIFLMIKEMYDDFKSYKAIERPAGLNPVQSKPEEKPHE